MRQGQHNLPRRLVAQHRQLGRNVVRMLRRPDGRREAWLAHRAKLVAAVTHGLRRCVSARSNLHIRRLPASLAWRGPRPCISAPRQPSPIEKTASSESELVYIDYEHIRWL